MRSEIIPWLHRQRNSSVDFIVCCLYIIGEYAIMSKLNYGAITVSFEANLGYKHTYFKFRCFIECMPWHGKLLFKFHISSLWVKHKFCFSFSVPTGKIKCQSIQTCFIKKMWFSIIYLNLNSLWHICFRISIH